MTRTNTSAAVKAQRAPDQVEADDARTALYRTLNYFPTPPWAARAGAELIRRLDPGAASVWEPACGEGHMAAPLSEYFVVCPSDIHPFGFGDVVDFLDEAAVDPECDWIVSNPPFKTAEQFVRLALRRARRGVAMLLRLQFLETESRFDLFYGDEPLTACAVFAERVSMFLGCWDPSGSSLGTGYAWFFWMKGAAPRPMIGIPPGTKQRLTRRDDAERFGLRRPAGLLEAMEAAE